MPTGVSCGPASHAKQRPSGRGDDEQVEPARLRRQAMLHAALRHPVAGERGNDPAADQRDQQDDQRNGELPAEVGKGNDAGVAEIIERVGQAEQEDHARRPGMLRLLRLEHLARGEQPQDEEEADIEESREPQRHRGGKEKRQPRGCPQTEQSGERPSGDRQPAGPVRDGGKQEPGDHRADEAEQHFVPMPGERLERGRKAELARQRADPQGERDQRPRRAGEEEGPEAATEEGVRRGHAPPSQGEHLLAAGDDLRVAR